MSITGQCATNQGGRAVFDSTPPFSQGDIGINASGGSTNFDTRNELAIFSPGNSKPATRGDVFKSCSV
jgi:hypothetical protein